MERIHGIALWRQIYETLKKDILNGQIKPGEMLPTEHALSSRFDVNRHTVRRAIQALSDKGLVSTRQGSGTFVPETIVDYAVKKRTRFSEAISAQSRVPMVKVLSTKTAPGKAEQIRALRLKHGARVVCIRTLGTADDTPLSLSEHYFDARRFSGLAKAVEETGSISRALCLFGVADYARNTTRVTTRLPSREEAQLLAQPTLRPVLVTENINVTPDGNPVEFGQTLFAGDRVQVVFET